MSILIFCGRLRFCGDTEHIHSVSNPTPIDEVACYTSTSLPWLVIAAAAVLATNMACAFTTLVVTSTSLPPAIRVFVSAIVWLFGFDSNSKDEEEEEDKTVDEVANDEDGDNETAALHV